LGLEIDFGDGEVLLSRIVAFFFGITGGGKIDLGAGPTFKILLAGASLRTSISFSSSNFLF